MSKSESKEVRDAKNQYEYDKNKLGSQVGQKVQDIKEEAQEKYDYAKDKVKQGAQNVKDYSKETAEDLKDKYDHTKDKAHKKYDCAKDKAKQGAQNVKDYSKETAEDLKEKFEHAKDKTKETAEDIREKTFQSNYLEQTRKDTSSAKYNDNLSSANPNPVNVNIKDSTLYGQDKGAQSEPLGYKKQDPLADKDFSDVKHASEAEFNRDTPQQEGGILQSAKDTISSAYNVVATKLQETAEAAKEKMDQFLHHDTDTTKTITTEEHQVHQFDEKSPNKL